MEEIELTVQATVFNPKLIGRAVHLNGRDVDGNKYEGNFIVTGVEGEFIHFTGVKYRSLTLSREDLDPSVEGSIKLKVLS